MIIGGWGNYPVVDAKIIGARSEEDVARVLKEEHPLIARGMGRSYGDSSLSETILLMTGMNRILSFNENSGEIVCEAGVSLEELLDVFVPRGWFLPVTPGTKFVTVGGAIASDVHGKNHHAEGSFSDHVTSLDLMVPGGKVVTCSAKTNAEIFHATAGGMGLTGIILRATFRLKRIESAFIKQRTIKARNLDEILELFDEYAHYTHSMSWIDCLAGGEHLGRSILMVGEHASAEEVRKELRVKDPLHLPRKRKLNVPFNFPDIALNSLTVQAFNFLYYNKVLKKITDSYVTYDQFFYPLDSIHNWNRIYGSRGFTQFQFVLPRDGGRDGLREIITRISDRGMGTFLLVLKHFGKGNKNFLSFPKEGYTLALDFPITRNLLPFLEELDRVVMDYGGRLYLTKDSRMSPDMLRKGYEDWKKFEKVRNKVDKSRLLDSLQSRRLEI